MSYLQHWKIDPTGVDSFFYNLIPIDKEGKNENGRVASPISVPILLQCLSSSIQYTF